MDQVGWFSIVYGPANQSVRSKKKKEKKRKKKEVAMINGRFGWGVGGGDAVVVVV